MAVARGRKRLRPPHAETIEVLEVAPRATVIVAGIGLMFYTARDDVVGMRYCALALVSSLVVATAMTMWHELLERRERGAAFERRLQHVRMQSGRATVTVALPGDQPISDHH